MIWAWTYMDGAACLWQQVVPRVGMLEAWTVNARIFLLIHYARADGFDLFIPASVSNRTDETLAAASRYIRGEQGDELKRMELAYEIAAQRIVELTREVEGLRGFKRSVDEALNSGDGSYRP